MLTQEIPECPVPSLTRNGELKKDVELFEKKVRVRVEEVWGWVCFLQSWFEGGRAKISTKMKRTDTFLRPGYCAALSSFRVRKVQFL